MRSRTWIDALSGRYGERREWGDCKIGETSISELVATRSISNRFAPGPAYEDGVADSLNDDRQNRFPAVEAVRDDGSSSEVHFTSSLSPRRWKISRLNYSSRYISTPTPQLFPISIDDFTTFSTKRPRITARASYSSRTLTTRSIAHSSIPSAIFPSFTPSNASARPKY